MSEETKLDLSGITVNSLYGDTTSTTNEGTLPQKEEVENQAEIPEAEDQQTTEVEDTQEGTFKEEENQEQEQAVSEQEGSEEQVEERSVIEELNSRLGYDVEGDFNDDYDGLTQYVQKAGEQLAQKQLESTLLQFPDVNEYLSYRMNGGEPNKYFETVSNSNDLLESDFDPNNKVMMRKLYEDDLRNQGMDYNTVLEMVEKTEDAGLLQEYSKLSYNKMKKEQAASKERLLNEQREQADLERKQQEEQWNYITGAVSKGQIKNFVIPVNDRQQFLDFISKPVDNQGRTARDLQRDKMDMDTILALEYLAYKDLDLGKLVSNTKKSQATLSLKEKLQKSTNTRSRVSGGKSFYQPSGQSPQLPSLDELIGG